MLNIKHTLPIDFETFGFVEREKKNGKILKNRCGRDFLYYVLHYYFPEEFNPITCGPVEIDERKVFGIPMPSWLVWTCLPFYKIPALFSGKELELKINENRIASFLSFLGAIIFPKCLRPERAIAIIEASVDSKQASGIDISIALGGLVDHVMFVFGYDSNNFYAIDTHAVKKLEYEKLTPGHDNQFIMKLPKDVVRKRWSRFNRVWVVSKSG